MKNTTIQVDKSLANSLKGVREYPRQPYNELIKKMNQYDEFLHKIQHTKMKELWDSQLPNQ